MRQRSARPAQDGSTATLGWSMAPLGWSTALLGWAIALLAGGLTLGCGGTPTPNPDDHGGGGGMSGQGGAGDEAPPQPVVKKETAALFAAASQAQGSNASRAIELLEDVAEQAPDLCAAYFNIGLLHERQGKLDDARTWYQKAAEKGCGSGLNNLGVLLDREGRHGEAVGAYTQALNVEPLNGPANLNLALESRKQKQWAEAVKRVRTALKEDSQNVDAYEVLAKVYYDLGRFELAKLVCFTGIKIDEKAFGIHNTLGLVYLKLDDVTRALSSFEQAVAANPTYVPAHMNIGAITFSYRDYESAIRHFDAALKEEPKNATAILSRAVAARGLERFDEAEAGYKKVIEIQDGHVGAHYNLGVLYQEYTQKLDQALSEYELVLRYESRDAALRKDVTQRIQAVRIQIQNLKEMEEMQKNAPPPAPAEAAPPAEGAAPAGGDAPAADQGGEG